jgi:hypothetical protein
MSITTTKLDTTTGDEYVEGGRSVIIDGSDAICQTCLSRLRTFLGEVFTDETKGVPWIQKILAVKGADPADVGGILRREILASPEIVACGPVTVTMDDSARSIAVRFSARASSGETFEVVDEELSLS